MGGLATPREATAEEGREDHSGGSQHNARCAIAHHAQPFQPAAMKLSVVARDGSGFTPVSKAFSGVGQAAIGIEPHPQQAGLGFGRVGREPTRLAPTTPGRAPLVPANLHR
jgi:hypothetical protein